MIPIGSPPNRLPRTASLPIAVGQTSPIPILQSTGFRPASPATSRLAPGSAVSKSPSPATSPSPSLGSSRKTIPTSSLANAVPPSPGVYLHMQRRAILRKMTSLILSYHRRQEHSLPLPFIMLREYPRAVSMSRSLLSHLNALEAAGALKRVRGFCGGLIFVSAIPNASAAQKNATMKRARCRELRLL